MFNYRVTSKIVFTGVLENVGVEPQVERIGKYKSAGDQLIRKNMSEENCEMLTSLLDNIYGNWLDKVSHATGLFVCFLVLWLDPHGLYLTMGFEIFIQERKERILKIS